MRPRSSGADHAPGARIAALAEARAALAAGASPATALQAVGHQPELAAVASAVRLGASVARVAATVDTGDPSLDLLVRALGVAEHAGAGGIDAVEQALAAVREEADLQRLLRARTAQARGTARLLGWLPFVAWSLFALADPRVLGYPATPLGAVTTTAAVLMAVGGQLWSRRIVGRAEEVAAAAEPLRPPPPGWQWRRGAAVAVPAGVVLVLAAGAGLAIGGTAILLLAAARPTAPRRAGLGGAPAGPPRPAAAPRRWSWSPSPCARA